MKVQLVADEFFSWGVYGGFGSFSRKLGKELVNRGIEVDAIVQKISDSQKSVGETEEIDGVTVKTLPRSKYGKFRRSDLYSTDADIIHSQCGRLDTYWAFRRNKDRKKIVTIQDLRTREELEMISPAEPTNMIQRLWSDYVDRLFKKALDSADAVCCQARLLIPKIMKRYRLEKEPKILPNFVDIPGEGKLKKDVVPNVVWLGRLDEIKRPELCFELAKENPNVTFWILGAAHDKERDKMLRERYGNIDNLKFMGFQDGILKEDALSKAWVLINTSIYECLPVSFLEAAAHKCAILSTQNPDDFTSSFGRFCEPTVELLCRGLKELLYADEWKHLGEKGYLYVKENHSTEAGLSRHIDLYKELLA